MANITPLVVTGSGPSGSTSVTIISPVPLPVSNDNLNKSYGTWAYYSGAAGTVVVTAGQRVLSISCHATTVGSVTINGGTAIPIPANVGFSISMTGILTAPTVVFTGTDSYFIETVI